MNALARSRSALVLITVAAAALTGCTAAPDTSTPSSTSASGPGPASTTPSASATSAPSAASVILGSRVADIVAADSSVIGRIDFFGATDSAVEVLTTAFGAEPDVSEYAAGIESPAGTEYDWGGFRLRDPEPAGSTPLDPEFFAQASAPSVGDVVIAGPGGVRVGDGVADLSAKWADEPAVRIGESSFSFDIVEVGPAASPGEQVKELSVFAVAQDTADTITMISTPVQNWGV
ncbi:hypothetical protein HQQ80_07415 [Microbacteriaceae bacterium VKM Ac-2855]|nr:hypothetical protein [Microbacteriaceae bacterium VKM Ac-2855]